jgi:hypothetical protein
VSRFPNVIRLANRPGHTRNRRDIVADVPPAMAGGDPGPADDEDVHEVTGTRAAHAEPVPTPQG